MPLPDFVVLGGMKCGTTALHRLLSGHADLAMAPAKELNFFFGEQPGGPGNWWRGVTWYARQLPDDGRLRGEASPGYTSPDHPAVAARMAALLPGVKLLYLTRDPLTRAVSQYLHHRRDGHERRPLGAALLDPASQYVARSRHADRLAPFRARFPPQQLLVVAGERLRHRPGPTLRTICRFLGVDADALPGLLGGRWNAAGQPHPPVPPAVRAAFLRAVHAP